MYMCVHVWVLTPNVNRPEQENAKRTFSWKEKLDELRLSFRSRIIRSLKTVDGELVDKRYTLKPRQICFAPCDPRLLITEYKSHTF